jgi:hypothetical protein
MAAGPLQAASLLRAVPSAAGWASPEAIVWRPELASAPQLARLSAAAAVWLSAAGWASPEAIVWRPELVSAPQLARLSAEAAV